MYGIHHLIDRTASAEASVILVSIIPTTTVGALEFVGRAFGNDRALGLSFILNLNCHSLHYRSYVSVIRWDQWFRWFGCPRYCLLYR